MDCAKESGTVQRFTAGTDSIWRDPIAGMKWERAEDVFGLRFFVASNFDPLNDVPRSICGRYRRGPAGYQPEHQNSEKHTIHKP